MSNNKNTLVDLGGIEPITNAVGMLYNIGSGIANQVQNAQNDKWNKAFAREQFDYQKSLNQLLMDREDNAVQRRAKDLEAAGISKNLAAGSPAQSATMSAGNSGAVANSNKQFQQMQKMDIMNSYAQYKMIMSEKNLKNVQAIVEAKKEGLIDEQKATERINQLVGQSEIDRNNSITRGQNIKNDRDRRDAEIDERRGLKSNETVSSKFADFVAGVEKVFGSEPKQEVINIFDPSEVAQWREVDSPQKTKNGDGWIFMGIWCKTWKEIRDLCQKRKVWFRGW